jgi:hypothetical protein
MIFLQKYSFINLLWLQSYSNNHYLYQILYNRVFQLLPNCILSKIIPLFSRNNIQTFNYTYYSKLYGVVPTKTIITFTFRYDRFYWCRDDVSVTDLFLKIEFVMNGHFENNLSNKFLCFNLPNNRSTILFLVSLHPFNGRHSFCDGTVGLPDYLNQTFNTKIGQVYRISFCLQNQGDAPNSTQVMMSY